MKLLVLLQQQWISLTVTPPIHATLQNMGTFGKWLVEKITEQKTLNI